jgi:hypothetical protein
MMPYNYYWTVCDACRIDEKVRKARHIPESKYDDPVFFNDKYFKDLDALLDYYYEDDGSTPGPVFGSTAEYIKLNPESILSGLEEEVMFDDEVDMFPDKAYSEVYDFCNQWNEKYKFEYYIPNYKIVIDLEDEKED